MSLDPVVTFTFDHKTQNLDHNFINVFLKTFREFLALVFQFLSMLIVSHWSLADF